MAWCDERTPEYRFLENLVHPSETYQACTQSTPGQSAVEYPYSNSAIQSKVDQTMSSSWRVNISSSAGSYTAKLEQHKGLQVCFLRLRYETAGHSMLGHKFAMQARDEIEELITWILFLDHLR